MSLFTTRDTSVSRRLLFVAGALMLATGLLLSLFQGRGDRRTIEESGALAQLIHQRLGGEAESATGEAEFDRLTASIDLATAPLPQPTRLDQEDYGLFVDITAEFLAWYFDAIGYTVERMEGPDRRAVPPVVLMSIAPGWADDQSIAFKKGLFYRALLPLVLLENRAVLRERNLVERYAVKQRNRTPVSPEERQAVRNIALRYEVIETDSPAAIDARVVATLLSRVDMVPASLALGQAAYESGYATSRFAHTGNALFGQWDWDQDAMRPAEQRKELGQYGVRAFDYPIDSVRAYLWNLNTHPAYDAFRQKRATLRGSATGFVSLDGVALAETLAAYAELGEEYTKMLQDIITSNALQHTEDLRLLEGKPVFFD